MSGYLRWLVQRALGSASGVRPARRLPSFASGISFRSEGAAAFAETVPGEFGAAERPFDPPSPEPVRPALADAVPATPRKSVEPPRTTFADDFSAAASRDQAAPASQPDFNEDRRAQHAVHSVDDDRPLRARPEIADDKPSSDVSGRRGVVPRAPVVPRTATRSTRTRPAGDSSEPRPAASPAPDVHIHIGRVELTAVTAAAAPRRESAGNAKKPMSLEEYLRRRSGRPS